MGMPEQIAELLVGDSEVMIELRRLILQFAPTRIPMLLVGPTGAGKELVASALHLASGRRGAFVAFNVCALPDSMFEDALFGHVRGAFTGASNDSPGYLREADRGTVLLDEIGGLAVSAQMKLLRAIETGVFRPVGAARDQRSDFRLISATNEDLSERSSAGGFRMDLLHRLGGFVLRVPPLSTRPSDIPLLMRHFARSNRGGPLEFHTDAMDSLKAYWWPGNVRELKRAAERLAVLARRGRGDPADREACPRADAGETQTAGGPHRRARISRPIGRDELGC